MFLTFVESTNSNPDNGVLLFAYLLGCLASVNLGSRCVNVRNSRCFSSCSLRGKDFPQYVQKSWLIAEDTIVSSSIRATDTSQEIEAVPSACEPKSPSFRALPQRV